MLTCAIPTSILDIFRALFEKKIGKTWKNNTCNVERCRHWMIRVPQAQKRLGSSSFSASGWLFSYLMFFFMNYDRHRELFAGLCGILRPCVTVSRVWHQKSFALFYCKDWNNLKVLNLEWFGIGHPECQVLCRRKNIWVSCMRRVPHQAEQAAQNYCKELFAPHEVWMMVLLLVPVVMVDWAAWVFPNLTI